MPEASEKKKPNFLWPDVSTIEAAKAAAMGGAAVCGIVAIVTGAVATYATFSGPTVLGSAWSFVDAAMFAGLSLWIWRRVSRTASVLALLLYVIEQVQLWATIGPKNPVMFIFFVLYLIHGVRGTFRYQQLKKAPDANGV